MDFKEIEKGSKLFEHLSPSQKQAYAGWFDVMVNGKSELSVEDAHRKALELVAKSSIILQNRKAIQRLKSNPHKKNKPSSAQADEDMFI